MMRNVNEKLLLLLATDILRLVVTTSTVLSTVTELLPSSGVLLQ